MNKTYLGDGVYVQIESGQIKLTSEDGVSELNTIYLDLYTLEALNKYVKSMVDHYKREQKCKDNDD